MLMRNLTFFAKKYPILCKNVEICFLQVTKLWKNWKLQNIFFDEKMLSSVGYKEKKKNKSIVIQFLVLAVGPH